MSARTPTAPVMKPETARRYWILTVMFLATFVNYLDRATLAVVGPTIQTEFGISDVAFGWLSSAFIWAITITIVFFGLLMQRFGERLIGAIGLAGFSLATIFSGFAGGFGSLLAMRVTLGVFEAPTFPLNATLVRRWFPKRERAKSISVYQIGASLGTALGIPFLGYVAFLGGWRATFFVAGGLGLVVTVLWWLVARNRPADDTAVSASERAFIEGDETAEETADRLSTVKRKTTRADWRYVLTDRRLLSLYLVTGATSTAFFFFMTWLPKYMKESLGISVTAGFTSGLTGGIPYAFALLGIIFGGWLSDRLIKSGFAPGKARKVSISIGLAGTSILFAMPFVDSVPVALVIVSFAYFSASMGNGAWVLPTEVSRSAVAPLANSVYGFFTNLFGAISPVVAGYLLVATGNYNAMLIYIGVWAIVGLIAILFLLDDVSPTPLPEHESAVQSLSNDVLD